MSDQVYLISGNAIGWLAAGLAVVALFADWIRQHIRTQRRRRCPKCWYDMSHTEGLRCSECGYTGRSERKLFKARRRWKLVWLCLLMLLGGYGLRTAPAVKERGWVAGIPTTMLILAAPFLRPNESVVKQEVPYGPLRRWGYPSSPPPPGTDWQTDLFVELGVERLDEQHLWRWQRRLFEMICNDSADELDGISYTWSSLEGRLLGTSTWADGTRPAWKREPARPQDASITSRTIWPVGSEIYARIEYKWSRDRHTRWLAEPQSPDLKPIEHEEHPITFLRCGGIWFDPGPWSDGLTSIGHADNEGSLKYELNTFQGDASSDFSGMYFSEPIRWSYLSRQDVSLGQVRGSIQNLLTPVNAPRIAEDLPSLMQPIVSLSTLGMSTWAELHTGLNLQGLSTILDSLDEVTFAVKVELVRNQRVIATGELWYRNASDGRVEPWGDGISLKILDEAAICTATATDEWLLILRGDPCVALRDFQATKYWQGEVVLRPTVNIRP